MAISDFGICNNGEALYECLAMNVPVLIADNLTAADAYKAMMYESFYSDINLSYNGELVPELIGMNFAEKVTELWTDWVVNPRLKFTLIDKVYEELWKFLPLAGEEDKFVENRISYVAAYRPDDLMADEIMRSVEQYEGIREGFDKGDFRARSGEMRMQFLGV
jgi:lipid A disaccharide synthetase